MLYLALVHSPYPHARDQEHRQERGAEGARRQGRDHRQGPRGRRARMAADLPRLRQADGAGDRQGALPVSGSRRRVRRRRARSRRRRRRSGRRSSTSRSTRRRRSVPRAKTDKVLLRDDRESKTNHIYPLGSRRQGEGRARAGGSSRSASSSASGSSAAIPAPLEPCGCVAYFDTHGAAAVPRDVAGAARATARRLSLVTGIPEDKIHVISPDLGGGFGNKVPVYPGYVVRHRRRAQDRTAGEVDRDAHREPHEHRLRARLPHGRRDRRDRTTARSPRCTSRRPPTTARSTRPPIRASIPAGMFGIVTGSYDFPDGPRRSRRVLHEQGAGRHRLSLLVPRHRSEFRDRARHGHPGRRARHGCRWSCAGRTSSRRSSSRIRRRSASPTTAATTTRRCDVALEKIGYDDAAARSRPRSAPAAS